MPEKSEFDKALGELYDLTEWEDAEAAIRELHARGPEIEKLYLDSKILPGELRALVMVSNCLEREFIHRSVSAGARKRSAWPMRMAAASGWKEREPSEEKELPDDRRGEECT